MVIEKMNIKPETALRFEEMIYKAFDVVQRLIGVDTSEEIFFYATDLDNSYGGTLSLLALKYVFHENAGAIPQYLFSGKERDRAIFSAYSSGCETFIEINVNHIENDDEDSIIDTIIHEILHHLTNDEDTEHGEKWLDLAKYVSENSKYKIIK